MHKIKKIKKYKIGDIFIDNSVVISILIDNKYRRVVTEFRTFIFPNNVVNLRIDPTYKDSLTLCDIDGITYEKSRINGSRSGYLYFYYRMN